MNILSKHSISFKERLVFHGLLEMRATADLIDHLLVSKKFYAADKNFRPFALHCLLKLLWRELHKGAISRRENSELTSDPTSTLIPYFRQSILSCLSITVRGGMMIVVEPELSASRIFVKLRRQLLNGRFVNR